MELALRCCHLIYLFVPVLLISPLYLLGNEIIDLYLYTFLRQTLETAGPVYIKFGQWASTRYDFFPLALCEELNKLTQDAPSHSWEVTERTLRDEFKGDFTRSLEINKDKFIASGSIAQTYEGMLGDKRVAVKVQHPNISGVMAKDLELISKGIHWLDTNFDTHLKDIYAQFSDHLADQLDFRLEKQNLDRFRKNFKYWAFVRFPDPHVATEKVLVESFEEGHSIIEYIKARNGVAKLDMVDDAAQEKLASIGLSALLKMIISDNFIHADLHPGNILVRKTPPAKNLLTKLKHRVEAKLLGFDFGDGEHVPQCVFLDAGLATVITEEKKHHVESFFKSLLQHDGGAVAESILAVSEDTNPTQKAREGFIATMTDRTNMESETRWDLSNRTGDCMKDVMDIIRQYGIRVDTSIMVPFVSAITLEGWQYELDPTVSVLDHVQKQVFRQEYLSNLSTKFAHCMWKASEENLGINEQQPPSPSLCEEYHAVANLKKGAWGTFWE